MMNALELADYLDDLWEANSDTHKAAAMLRRQNFDIAMQQTAIKKLRECIIMLLTTATISSDDAAKKVLKETEGML